MSKDADMMARLVQDVITEVRGKYPESIDKAYNYFWEGESPDEFMSGTALSLGFHNFEDWLICDYKANDGKETFIDLYLRDHKDLSEGELSCLLEMRKSMLSLYEVVSVSKDKHVRLQDLFRDEEVELRDKNLSHSLGKGDIFATRLILFRNRRIMCSCVYPFSPDHKKALLKFFDRQYTRYIKNEKPKGTRPEFLKDYGDLFNIAWVDRIMNTKPREE